MIIKSDVLHAKYSSPSNIALVKYWGKKENQIPSNASISFTLSEAKTVTSVRLNERKTQDWQLDFSFEGQSNPRFQNRVKRYLQSIEDQVAWIGDYDIRIESENTFPHSSGIASSASAMSALAMCLVDIECRLRGESLDNEQLSLASNL